MQAYNGFQTQSSMPGSARLFTDPLGHCQSASGQFKKDTAWGRVLLPVLMAVDLLRLEDDPNPAPYPAPPEDVLNVTMYVMGDFWTTLPAPPVFKPSLYFLAPGKALSTDLPTSVASAQIMYDPANPVPSMGGNNLEISCGPLDQTPLESRSDVLVFSSPPLTEPLALSGPISATITFSTNVVDTDVVVKLIDAYPDGRRAHLLADGIARAKWRQYPASSQPNLLSGNPSQRYTVDVSLWNTTYVFTPGHSVRVHVSSSNSPRFLPNKNNGLPVSQYATSSNITANTTFWFGGGQPSFITLPVVEWPSALPEFPVEAFRGTPAKYAPMLADMRSRGVAGPSEEFGEWVERKMGPVLKRAGIARPRDE